MKWNVKKYKLTSNVLSLQAYDYIVAAKNASKLHFMIAILLCVVVFLLVSPQILCELHAVNKAETLYY